MITSAFAKPLTIRRQRVAELDTIFDAMEHQIHEAQPMGVGHQFKPYERIVPLKVSPFR